MAKQLSVNDKGSVRGEAYAKVRSIELNYTTRIAAVFIDYYNSANDAPITNGNLGGSETAEVFMFKRWAVEGEDFDAYFADSELSPDGKTAVSQAYAMAAFEDAALAAGADV